MRGYRKYLSFSIFLIAVSLSAWMLTLGYSQEAQRYENQVEWRSVDCTIGVEQLQALETEKEHFVLWRQEENQVFSNPTLMKSIQGSSLHVYGDLNMLMDASAYNKGYTGDAVSQRPQALTTEHANERHAILSTQLAYALWGTVNVIGETFEQEGIVYVVEGIFEEESCLALFKAEASDPDQVYSGLRIALKGMTTSQQQIETLQFKYQLPRGTWINLNLRSQLVSQIYLIPVWVVGLYALWKFYQMCRATQPTREHRMYLLLGATVIIVSVLGVMHFIPHMPTEFIPNQWSDFDFWMRLQESLLETQDQIKKLPSYWPDQVQEELIKKIGVSCSLVLVGFGLSTQSYRKYLMKKSATDQL